MGLFSNLLNSREIARLEELAIRSPAPSIFIRLSQLYLEINNEQQAVGSVERGVEHFPENKELMLANKKFLSAKHQAEKEQIVLKIEQYPNPALYVKLAAIYLEEDDFENCRKVCNDCLEHYKKNAEIYLILGQLEDRRGNLDECIAMLEKIAEHDKFNYTGLFFLAEKYKERGNLDSAEKVLNDILSFSPQNQKVIDFLSTLNSPVIEDSNEKKNNVKMVSTSSASITGIRQLKKSFIKIAEVEGTKECILMDKNGLVIASNIDDKNQEELLAALVTNIYRSSEICKGSLLLGDFRDGIIESEGGNIFLMSVADMLIAVFAEQTARTGLLQRAIHNFALKITQG